MVPIPGGKYTIGSPEGEAKRGEDEGVSCASEVEIKPFWMGKHEVTWDEFAPFQFVFSLEVKKKVREGVDLATQPANEKAADAVSRPTPPTPTPPTAWGATASRPSA